MAHIQPNISGCQKDYLLSEIEIGSEFVVEILREGQFKDLRSQKIRLKKYLKTKMV